MKCKVCGASSETEYCFRHKLRKPLQGKGARLRAKSPKRVSSIPSMRSFFVEVWNERKHNCENCGKWLGIEPLSYMFDHVLEKSKYPALKFEKENIMLMCLECHDKKTKGILTDLIRERITFLRKRFNFD